MKRRLTETNISTIDGEQIHCFMKYTVLYIVHEGRHLDKTGIQ